MHRLLRPGENPRLAMKNHRERGPKRFSFTYRDIAKACEMSLASIKTAASRKAFDPSDLLSVALFVASKRGLRPSEPT